jgi:simple sugar transport system ATP-binding protein
VAAGTLHAVLGENGAGKTTLMRAAFGMVRPDAGRLRVFGAERRFASPAEAIESGVGMVHQHFTIVPALTVAENVALGGRGRFDPRAAAERVRQVGAATGLVLDPDAPAGALPVAAQQRLEIVKALARAARVLILDEPGAVLGPDEAEELLGWLRRWVDAGGTAVLVTHKLRDALRHADAVTVLRRGRTVLARPVRDAAGALTEADLAAAMLGEAAAEGRADAAGEPALAQAPDAGGDAVGRAVSATPGARRPAAERPVVVRAAGVGAVDPRGVPRVRDATFALRAGELAGVAAVEGSGQHELLRLLAGRLAPAAGTLDRPDAGGVHPRGPAPRRACSSTRRWSRTSRSPAPGRAAAGCRGGRSPSGRRRSPGRSTCAAAGRRPRRARCRGEPAEVRRRRASWPARATRGRRSSSRRTRRGGSTSARRPRCGRGCGRRATRAPRWSSTRATSTRCSRSRTGCWWCTTGRVYDAPPDRERVGRLMLGATG